MYLKSAFTHCNRVKYREQGFESLLPSFSLSSVFFTRKEDGFQGEAIFKLLLCNHYEGKRGRKKSQR